MSESKTLPPPAILVVDDDPGLRSALRRILESEGYDCFEAADGESALDLMRAYELGLVVLDYAMPGLDGASVMRRMRNLPRRPATVMLTSGRHQSAQVDSLGVRGLSKPFRVEDLLEAVRSHRPSLDS